MELQSQDKSIATQKPLNKLFLQASSLQSRIFLVYSLDDALQKMIKIYGEAMTLKNSNNPQVKDTVRFSLKSMIQYYSSMEDINYMQKDNSLNQKSKEKHKTSLQSFDKDFVLASLKSYCIKKSTDKSIQLAKQIFKNGGNVDEVLKNMGFAV